VLLTGHTGFKGSWLAIWLHLLGAELSGIGLSPLTNPNLYELAKIHELVDSFFLDIRNPLQTEFQIRKIQPEIIFHLAAQPLVRRGYLEPLETFSTNTQGTVNVLNAARLTPSVRTVIAITTDKVYKNREVSYAYDENDPLGGYDPYSASKAAAELVVDCYNKSYFSKAGIALASARAGNVIGGGDWSEDRLIPDAIKAWGINQPLTIRNPEAIRPWQHVLEPINGYLLMAEHLNENQDDSGPYNIGPDSESTASVEDVINLAALEYQNAKINYSKITSNLHESKILMLDNNKSKNIMGIYPHWNLNVAIHKTMNWHQELSRGKNARNLCHDDILSYTSQT
jgi:CDP-glucose 4,6-dehydratase